MDVWCPCPILEAKLSSLKTPHPYEEQLSETSRR
jgi:hypothetical protein